MVLLFLLLTSAATGRVLRAQATQPIAYGDTLTGTIKSAEESYSYTFVGKKGDDIVITVERQSGRLRPLINLYRADSGDQLAVSDLSSDGKTATLSITLPDSGAYKITVASVMSDGATTGRYQITLEGPANSVPITSGPVAAPEGSYRSFTVGTSPIFSLWTGKNLYVANYGDGTVSKLDQDGASVGSLSVGGTPFDMGWDGERLWVANLGDDGQSGKTVTVFDANDKKIGTYTLGLEPFSMSYDREDSRMWVALYGENKIIAVDARGKVQASVDTENRPNTVLWTGSQLWATLAGDDQNVGQTVITLDSNATITGTYTVGKNPSDLAWSPENQLVYTADYDDGTVTALATSGMMVGKYRVGKEPAALAWDGQHLWVS
ncbi:MAG TPA: YncE family protein, partial [Aggregatilineales bacterium]|nr:YncE family protein [Aggregatilineales bacterium]